jgi:hypothetical protein
LFKSDLPVETFRMMISFSLDPEGNRVVAGGAGLYAIEERARPFLFYYERAGLA